MVPSSTKLMLRLCCNCKIFSCKIKIAKRKIAKKKKKERKRNGRDKAFLDFIMV